MTDHWHLFRKTDAFQSAVHEPLKRKKAEQTQLYINYKQFKFKNIFIEGLFQIIEQYVFPNIITITIHNVQLVRSNMT